MIIEFAKDMPDAVRAAVEPIIQQWRWLIPGWVQEVMIRWQAQAEDGESADTVVSYEYRWVSIRLKGHWLSDARTQEKDIVHELIHAFTHPLAEYARNEMERLLPENEAPKYRAAVLEELRMRHESFVQDLAWCLVNQYRAT